MSSYYRTLIDLKNLNLLTQSEGNVTTYPTRTQVVDAPISIVGFDNSIEFGDNSILRYAYKRNFTPTIGVSYNLSCYIEMEDGGAPVIGINSITGDFAIVMNGAFTPSDLVVTFVSGSIYRVSASRTSINNVTVFGIIKYTGQSARKFKISGIQLTEGEELKPYQKTT